MPAIAPQTKFVGSRKAAKAKPATKKAATKAKPKAKRARKK